MTTVPPTVRILGLVAVVLGCSSSVGPSSLLSVGGTYQTAVALVSGRNTCNGVTVADNPTVVDHTPGSATVGLTHAGTRYDGQVQVNGSFTAGPKTVVIAGTAYVISPSGQFSTRGFTASIPVQVTSPAGPACEYLVSWTGTKQGNDNVIP